MPELLQYSFEVVGAANVEKALASMERRFAQHNARMTSMFSRPAGGGSSRGGGGLRPGTGGMAGNEAVREQLAMMKKLEKEQIASAKRVERERISSEKAVGREQEKQEKYWANARSKSRELDARQREEEASSRATFVKSTIGNGAGRVLKSVRAVGSAALAMTGIGGAALAASSISQATKLDDMSRRIAIQGRAAGTQGMDPNVMRKQFTQTGIATGLAPEDVAAGVSKYVDRTGDVEGGMRHMGTMATISQASGARMEDVADTTWALKQAGITSKEDVQSSLSTLYGQGKSGSFKLADNAQFMPELIASGKDFGIRGKEGVKSLGGFLQVAQDATGNSDKSATALIDVFAELTKHASKMATGEQFSGHKVNVYEKGDAKNGARNIRDIIGDTLTASRGNSSQVEEVLGIRGMPAMKGMLSTFKDTRLAALKGGDSDTVATKKGHDAALKMWDDRADAGMDFKEVQRDAGDAMKGFGAQMEIIQSQMKDIVASELFPRLIELAPKIKELMPAFTKLVKDVVDVASFFANNPFAGLGAAVSASILYEIASAGLGKIMASALTEAMAASVAAQAASGGGIGGVLSGGRAALNGGGMVGTLGAAALAAGSVYMAVDQGKDLQKAMGGSFLAALPGFNEKGSFDMGRLGSDLSSPLDSAAKKADQAMNENAKADRVAADAAAAQAARDQVEAAKMQAAAIAKFAASVDKMSTTGMTRPNTGNAPSPVK